MNVKIAIDGFPLEYRFSANENMDGAGRQYLNVNEGIELPYALKDSGNVYSQTMNNSRESKVVKISEIPFSNRNWYPFINY